MCGCGQPDCDLSIPEVRDWSKGVRGKYAMPKKDTEKQYRFVSGSDDVDYIRIVREAPQGTPFILVEEKTRNNKPRSWVLFVHTKILKSAALKDKRLGFEPNKEKNKLGGQWGEEIQINGTTISDYRYIKGVGKAHGLLKHQIDAIRNHNRRKVDREKRNTLTEVQYL